MVQSISKALPAALPLLLRKRVLDTASALCQRLGRPCTSRELYEALAPPPAPNVRAFTRLLNSISALAPVDGEDPRQIVCAGQTRSSMRTWYVLGDEAPPAPAPTPKALPRTETPACELTQVRGQPEQPPAPETAETAAEAAKKPSEAGERNSDPDLPSEPPPLPKGPLAEALERAKARQLSDSAFAAAAEGVR